jgi:hypothetical protein
MVKKYHQPGDVPPGVASFYQLSQRFDSNQRLLPLSVVPILQQLSLMERRPLNDQAERSWGKVSSEYGERRDVNQHFLVSIKSVEMRRIVIIPEHPDHDPEEPGKSQA